MARQKFLACLQGKIARRGVIDVLRHGFKHGGLNFDLFCGKPSAESAKAVERHAKNRFSITFMNKAGGFLALDARISVFSNVYSVSPGMITVTAGKGYIAVHQTLLARQGRHPRELEAGRLRASEMIRS